MHDETQEDGLPAGRRDPRLDPQSKGLTFCCDDPACDPLNGHDRNMLAATCPECGEAHFFCPHSMAQLLIMVVDKEKVWICPNCRPRMADLTRVLQAIARSKKRPLN